MEKTIHVYKPKQKPKHTINNPFITIANLSKASSISKPQPQIINTPITKAPPINFGIIPTTPVLKYKNKTPITTPLTQPISKSMYSTPFHKCKIPPLEQSPISSEENELQKLKMQLLQKTKEIEAAKQQINAIQKENNVLKQNITHYKDKIANIINDANFMSKETLSKYIDIYCMYIYIVYNYFYEMNGNHSHQHGIQGAARENVVVNIDNMTYEEMLELEDKIGYVNRGFSVEQVAKIKKEEYSCKNNISGCNSDDNKCVICQFNFEEGNIVKKLDKCGHLFHSDCIDSWLLKEKKCPYCKDEIVIN
jgi:hypothetical protein